LRIGQCRYFSAKTERKPVLLLDDVLLELDGKRRERFLAHLPEYEQAFFTFLPDEKYTGLSSGETSIFLVEDGWITAQ
jgi:DNA replication and repair protein RecF